jgi:signal transduction histidine kinase
MSGASTPSIQTRLLWRTIATVMTGSIVSAIAAALAVSAVVRTTMESALEETAQALVVLAEHEAQVASISHGRALPAPAHRELLLWQLRTSSGRLVARSHDAPDEPWPSVPLVEGHQRTAGLAVYTLPGQDLWLQVAQPLTSFRRAQFTAAIAAGGTVLILGLLASSALGWAVRHELRPVADFARAVDTIGPDSTDLAPPLQPRRELAIGYAALSAMLGRLQAKLRSERAFAAHAAHALRTPLAGLSAQLEMASVSEPAEAAERIGKASESADRLAAVIKALLSMTRATESIQWHDFEAAGLTAVATGRQINVDSSQLKTAGPLKGDEDLLAAAVANLLDNSERHGAHHVRLRAERTADGQCIELKDDGPGVATAALKRLEDALRRFEAAGEIDSALGLGLTLAATVARAHCGSISLDCNRDGDAGFCVRLRWPAAPGPAAAHPVRR